MQYAIFSIPITCGQEEQETMNKFLRSHKVVKTDKELIRDEQQSYWTFCITYLQGQTQDQTSVSKEKVDYKEVLDEKAFKMFSDLRALRKQIAQNDAVPAYAVFTDAELAEMTVLPTFDEKSLQGINGIGNKRAEKYGRTIVDMYNNTLQVEK